MTGDAAPSPEPDRTTIGLGIALLAAIVGFAAWLFWNGMPGGVAALGLTPEGVESFVAAWGMWSAVGSMLLMILHSFMPIPAEVIAIANGMLFGNFGGVVVTWAGAMLGALSAFAVARWLGRPVLCRAIADPRRARIEAWVARPGALLILRLIPVVSFNLVNVAAGLAGVSWWAFLWTTAIGILPLTIASVLLGSHIFAIGWPVWAAIGAAIVLASLLGRCLVGATMRRK